MPQKVSEAVRAAALAQRDKPKQATRRRSASTSSDSEKEIEMATKRRREMELRRQLAQEEDDVAAIERQIAEARAKRNAKMEELVLARNSYPVNLIQCAVVHIQNDSLPNVAGNRGRTDLSDDLSAGYSRYLDADTEK
jgi:hypothetical protein